MFTNARLKLTLWYVLGMMVISVVFSFVIYRNLVFELRRGLGIQALRFTPNERPEKVLLYDVPLFEETKLRVIHNLVLINMGILVTASGIAYFLAGKTLSPIETMVEEQKRFVADASHELRTPLTVMKSEVEVALRDKKLTLADMHTLLKSNLEEVDKLTLLTNYLLTLSRYENGSSELTFNPLDLDLAVERAVVKARPLAHKKHITITQKLDPLQG